MSGKRIVIGRTADATVLNPILYRDLATGEILNRLFDHLVLTDGDGRLVPGRLVRRWEALDGGLSWIMHLRPDSRWHDGCPVTASDASFTFAAIADAATGSGRRSEFVVEGEPIRFDALSRHRLRVRLPAPYAPLLAVLAWRPVLPEHVYGDGPIDRCAANDAPIGSGPFVFAGRERGRRLTMAANGRYHAGRPPLDEVVWERYADQAEAVDALLRGGVHYVPGVAPELLPELEGRAGVRVLRTTDASFAFLGFNNDHPLFADRRVRHAILHAVDRERLVRHVLQGEGRLATSPVTPASPWHNSAVPAYGHDVRRAERLLDDAGWTRAADGIRRNGARERLAFTLLTVRGDRVKEEAAAAVARDCAAVGIDVAVGLVDLGALLDDHLGAGRFETVLLGLAPSLDPAFLHGFYHSGSVPPNGLNWLRYGSPVVDELLDRSQRELDPTERKAIVAEIQARIADDVPHVLLFHATVLDACSARLLLPAPPRAPGNRFMDLHAWDVDVATPSETAMVAA